MKRFFIVVTCLLICFVLAACSSPAASSATPPAGATSGTAAPSADGGPVKVMFIPKNQGNPYFEAIVSGFKEAMAEIGEDKIEFATTGPATADATSQIEYVEAAVQNGYDVIFIAANSNDALNGTFDDARAAGTKIIIINQDITGNEDRRDGSIMPLDFGTVAVSLLDHVRELIGDSGEFAVLSATTDAPDQNAWIKRIKNLIAEDSTYSGLKLLEVVYGDDQPEKSTTETEALLTKYPDIKCIVAPTTVGIAAAAKVLKTKGKGGADGVQLTGLGLPSEMAEFVLDGTVKEFKLWNPPYEGYIASYMAVAMVNGGLELKAGASFEAGKLGTVKVNADNIIYTLPELFTFDKGNIEEYAAQF